MAKSHYKDAPSDKERKSFAQFLAEDEELVLVTGFGKVFLRTQFILYIAWPGGMFLILSLIAWYFFRYDPGYSLLVGLSLAILVALLKVLHLHHANRYLLTTRRVIIKKGVFAVRLTSALYDKITHIEVDQAFLDKLLYHHGTIIVNTAGMNKGEITLKYVDYPVELKNLLERLINREREQFGRGLGTAVTLEGELV